MAQKCLVSLKPGIVLKIIHKQIVLYLKVFGRESFSVFHKCGNWEIVC